MLDGWTTATLNGRNDVVAAGSLCITLIFRDSYSIIMASTIHTLSHTHTRTSLVTSAVRFFASDLFTFGVTICTRNDSMRMHLLSTSTIYCTPSHVNDMNYYLLNGSHSTKAKKKNDAIVFFACFQHVSTCNC